MTDKTNMSPARLAQFEKFEALLEKAEHIRKKCGTDNTRYRNAKRALRANLKEPVKK